MTTNQEQTNQSNALFTAAHDNWNLLQSYRLKLRNVGLREEDLPDSISVQAFALLGEHEKHIVEAKVSSLRSALDAMGLLPAAASITTPVMRLMLHVAPLLTSLESLWSRLMNTEQVDDASLAQLRCVSRVRGLWGQRARVHFAAVDTAHVLIRPGVVFSTEPAILTAGSDGRCQGSFTIPIDEGTVTLTLALRNGEMRRHRIAVSIGQPLSARI